MEYVELAPIPALAHAVRTVWIQSAGDTAYVQRHLPTGGAEIHVPVGSEPRLLGPLTRSLVEVIAPRTTVAGVRFFPGAMPAAPASPEDLIDQHVGLADLRRGPAHRLAEAVVAAASPRDALRVLQQHVRQWLRAPAAPDPRLGEAVRRLMPWRQNEVASVAAQRAWSPSQLRRRCLDEPGIGPKVLQRTLRFQGWLALAQAGAAASGRRSADGMSGLAIDVGYADQAHLSRECKRLTGLTPTALLSGDLDRCACGHDHTAAYRPFLATRARQP